MHATLGTMGGQASICLFSAVYILAARKLPWWLTAPLAIAAFMLSAFVWNSFALSLMPPGRPGWLDPGVGLGHPRPENPAKISAPVVGLTRPHADLRSVCDRRDDFCLRLGPQLSGLFSTLPIFATILSIFTHAQQGGLAARQLMPRDDCRLDWYCSILPGDRYLAAFDWQPVGVPAGSHRSLAGQWRFPGDLPARKADSPVLHHTPRTISSSGVCDLNTDPYSSPNSSNRDWITDSRNT